MRNTKTILLIEDDIHDQLFFRLAVERIPEVRLYAIANHGRKALDMLSTAEVLPDLIFTDIHMPLMDGLECMKQLRRDERLSAIPVIVLSTAVNEAKNAHELGARIFIEKPYSYEKLYKSIKQVIMMDFTTASVAIADILLS